MNSCNASGYQNECRVQAACLNASCDAGPQEIAKSTSSMTLGAVSARNPWNGNTSSAAVTTAPKNAEAAKNNLRKLSLPTMAKPSRLTSASIARIARTIGGRCSRVCVSPGEPRSWIDSLSINLARNKVAEDVIAGKGDESHRASPPMSASGQKQTSAHVRTMSALPPKADIETPSCDVCRPQSWSLHRMFS